MATDFAAEFVSGLHEIDAGRKWAMANMPVGCPVLTFSEFAEPTEYDPRSKILIHNQLRMSSCVGHGTTTAVEETSRMAGAPHVELSRMLCYLLAQDESGIRTDSGATMEGAARALMKGCCAPEALFPYPTQYNRNIPEAAIAKARQHPCKTTRVLPTYEDCLRWLKQGLGGITIGIPWTESLANHRGRRIESVSGRSLGGHCVCYVGFTKDGYLIKVNSHGGEWGWQGTAEVSPQAHEQLVAMGGTYIGTSDMTHIENPRRHFADVDFNKVIAG